MAHKKAAGSAKNLRDSNPKYRGLKLSGWQFARAGNIILRQKWNTYVSGLGTYMSKDFTIHAKVDGVVVFRRKNFIRFDGRKYQKTIIELVDADTYVQKWSSVENTSEVVKEEKATKKAVTKKVVDKKTAPKKAATKKVDKKVSTDTWSSDDLTKIEGIGPKIAELLNAAWIMTFADLSTSKVWDLRDILANGGNRFKMHDPKTWKKQATLAKNGKWDELKKLQDELDGGK